MRLVVLANARAGSGRREPDRISAALRAAAVDGEVRAVRGRAIAAAAREAVARGAAAVVAAGGDGTVSAVAGVLAGTATPLGVLPLGTFNHFARDLGLPLELDAAARVLAAGAVRAVDVAEVNGRVFVNNSSIGLYPLAVRDRERRRLLPKSLAMAVAMLRTLARLPVFRLRLRLAGSALPRRTPILFVGNNAYDLDLFAPHRRTALDKGTLSVITVRHATRLKLVDLALRAAVGRLDAGQDLEALAVPELVVGAPRRRILVSADGEVFRSPLPLVYRTRPGALRVLAPPPGTAA